MSTGARQGELLALRWSDYVLQDTLIVRRSARHYAGRGVVYSSTKGRRARHIILSQNTAGGLHQHREDQRVRRLLAEDWEDNDLIFPDPVGRPWLAQNFYKQYRKVVEAAGLSSDVDFHTLRHTAASHWLAQGVDVLVVSRRLGHASTAFTMDVYSHLLPGQQQKAAEVMDGILEGQVNV